MGIEIQQKGMAGLYGAAAVTAKLSKEQKEAQRREDEKMQQQHQMNMKQMDYQLDLEKYERAKRWEIDKMELSSQIDFQREEQSRQRELDGYDNSLSQIDKEVQAGRMTEEEAEPYKLKINLNKEGVNVSVSEITRQQEEDEYGVQPYWMRGREAAEDTPERQLYESKLQQEISGKREGTVPYYLNQEFLRNMPPQTAQDMLMNKGIFFDSDEEFEEFLSNLESAAPTQLPLGDKELDIGVRTEVQPETPTRDKRIRVISPEGQSGTILESELQNYINQGFTIVGKPTPKQKKPLINLDYILNKGFK